MKVVQRIAKWSFYLVLLSAIASIAAWQGWAWWSWASSPPVPSSDTEQKAVHLEILPGTPAQQIGEKLESAGLIRSSTAWKLWARWLRLQESSGEFKAGTYKLSPTQPMAAIADTIWKGEVVTLNFTIPEGWSIKQMAAYFESKKFFKAEDFLKTASQIPKTEYPWLPDNIPHLEGFLYPDTYQLLGDNITPQAVIRQMLTRFQQVALPLYSQGTPRTKMNLLEWVTLASIVEKEAVIPTERPLIAGVFARRLQQSIALGADPTVEYGLGVTQTPDRPLTLSQVNTPNPYNTYINPGLPPTPISSPGLASLKAAIAPEKTDFLYFVARYDGSHVFSRTLAEHESAQDAIHDGRDANRQSAPQPTSTPNR